jgi:hypothetical protein
MENKENMAPDTTEDTATEDDANMILRVLPLTLHMLLLR